MLKDAIKIYYTLLQKGKITNTRDKEIFNLYINHESIKETVDAIADGTHYDLVIRAETIYMIPRLTNETVIFSVENDILIKGIGKKADKQLDYYLSLYLMSVIFNEFFHKIAPLKFLPVDKIIEKATDRLTRAANQEDIEEKEHEIGYRVLDLEKNWSVREYKKNDDTEENINFKSQYGCVRKVIKYLDDAKLVEYWVAEKEIRPTDKLKDLMNYYFLDHKRKEVVEKILFNIGE